MNTNLTKQQAWNRAAKDGAVLASITIGASVISIVIDKITAGSTSTITAALMMAASMLLWVAKTGGSYLLLKRQLAAFGNAAGNPGKLFGYGVKVTLFSSILCSAFVAVNLLYISADTMSAAWDTVMKMYSGQMDSNSIEMLESIKEYMPVYSTVGQFIWMYLIGIIFSAIISSSGRRNMPFTPEQEDRRENGNVSDIQ